MSNEKIVTIDNLSLQELDTNSEIIPLLSPEDELEMHKENLPEDLAILPLRNMVLFPGVVLPITAGRDKSIHLLKEANELGKPVGVVSQINENTEDPNLEDIHKIGTVAKILKILNLPDGNITVILQGKKRFEIAEISQSEPYLKATVREVEEIRPESGDAEFKAIVESVKETSYEMIKENPNIPSEASFAIKNIESDSFLINFVCSMSLQNVCNLLQYST